MQPCFFNHGYGGSGWLRRLGVILALFCGNDSWRCSMATRWKCRLPRPPGPHDVRHERCARGAFRRDALARMISASSKTAVKPG